MTVDRARKQKIRARMAETGEPFTVAARNLESMSTVDEVTIGWTSAGQLRMPPADVLGDGYGEIAGTEDNARAVWREVATIAGRNPKVALALGASLGGLFIKPLLAPQRSFWVHLVGAAATGKSTAQRWGASLYGDPDQVVEAFHSSVKGLTYRLGELGCLPVFLNEFGVGQLHAPAKRARAILSTCEGARRRVATRTGATRVSPPWHGVLLNTGSESMLAGITDEALHARMIEIPAPITVSIDDCHALQELLAADDDDRNNLAYGWPLHWLRNDLSLERFRTHVAAAERDLPLPFIGAGGRDLPLRSRGLLKVMAHNLCLAIAGAAELDRLIVSSTLRPAALAAARQVLIAADAELASPGEQVYRAVLQAVVSRATSFPTRRQFGLRGWTTFPDDVEGWRITDDAGIDGDVAVLASKFSGITAGIANTQIGLGELARDGVLLGSSGAGALRRHIRVGKMRAVVYVFRLDADERESPERWSDQPCQACGHFPPCQCPGNPFGVRTGL